MNILRQFLRLCVDLLFSVFGANMALAVPMATSDISHFQTETTQIGQADDVGFAARAPPVAATNVAITGGATVKQGGAFVLHEQETVATLSGFERSTNATNRVITQHADATFSVSDWNGYPAGVARPQSYSNFDVVALKDNRSAHNKRHTAMERIVLCMKWGSLFGPDYVNVLYSACKANLTGPFRFVCLTDNTDGLNDCIETFPIPEIGCTQEMWFSGAWPKLGVFMQDLYGLKGRALFIDLDTTICGPLDGFFEHTEPLIGIDTGKNWRKGGTAGPTGAHLPLLGTGVFAFTLGAQIQILERFQANPEAAFAAAQIEQVWVQEHASSVAYWPSDWVISFKRWLRRHIGVDLFLSPKVPPEGTGMVAFHGDPRPITLIRPGLRVWDKLPHLGYGQVSWIRDYWLKNGGKLPK